ncbi:TetR/AcrR family transcriptional regulator [Pseudooceanicola sp. LIPI14-2-Ac024]|uniref:TetR/AcrR family transcriptional regulator n=1 Tax=Pseudooceanicola sp. LIPI14-2-Ac024 TaxID=3344875 RepID=UPI0035D06B2A
MDQIAPIDPPATAETSPRFQQKRNGIIDAAATLINERGLKGLTFVAVAEAVGLNTTSVTYYFKRKEMLAATAIERTIDVLADELETAGREATPRDRVSKMIALYLTQSGSARLGEARPLTILSDMRAMDEPQRERLTSAYMARIARGSARLFGDPMDLQNRARGHILLDTLFWSRAWLAKYSVGDYERIGKKLMALFEHGILPDGATWEVRAPDRVPEPEIGEITPETYLRVATRLINERGYRGASVERIAGELNVSKGSFYHHLEGKDDLVLECFQRSYGRFSQAQRRAINLPGTHRDRLAACLGDLLDIQFEASFPLVRITALQALPTELRRIVLARSDRMATRFSGMISDGIEEGTFRPVDPLIASQWVTGLINSSHDMRFWAAEQPNRAEAVAAYAHQIAHGLFTPR